MPHKIEGKLRVDGKIIEISTPDPKEEGIRVVSKLGADDSAEIHIQLGDASGAQYVIDWGPGGGIDKADYSPQQ